MGILDEAFEGIATAKANAEKNLRNARASSKATSNPSSPNVAKAGWKQTLEEVAAFKTVSLSKAAPSSHRAFPSFVSQTFKMAASMSQPVLFLCVCIVNGLGNVATAIRM
ncbi:MAG: hypothetical protein U0936_11600 [Planctomycetaceae bacterium]